MKDKPALEDDGKRNAFRREGGSEGLLVSSRDGEKVKILLVDDHPHKLLALEAILENEHFLIEKASSGLEALRFLLREDYAVILLDVNMPVLDGYETAALIRHRKRSESLPIIFVTASSADDQSASKGYSLGAVDYINAPVIPEVLKAKVAVFVELFRVNRKVQQQAESLLASNLDLEVANRMLESNSRELQISRESFRNIVEKNQEGIAIVDVAGVVRFANPAFGRMLGGPPGGLVGQAFPYALEAGKILEVDHPISESRTVPIEISLMETQWDGAMAYLASVRDLTARRSAEESMRDTEEKLRQAQKLESIGRLAGGIAHDFNNLLTAINGYTDLMIASSGVDEEFNGYLQEVRRAGERAAELTHQLLAYSRKQMLIPKLLNLNAVVENMTNMLRRLIGDHVVLISRMDPNLGLVKVDPGQMEQVIMNLVINAKDAMPSGGQIVVETALEKDPSLVSGQYVVLSVIDSGTGMDAVTLARIFEPFFTTKEVGQGTGLGLSVVYGIIAQSGGNITVTSVPGEGSTFKVYLPVAAGANTIWQPTIFENGAEAGSGKETILLVEDENTVRKFLSGVMRQKGYKVLEALDGQEALDFAIGYAEPIHLLLTDLMMPNMGGKELAEKLSLRRPDMKLVFMSGYAAEGSSYAWDSREGIEFLQKPISHSLLTQKVRSVLDAKPTRIRT